MDQVLRALVGGLGLLMLATCSPLHAAPGDPVGGEFQVNTYTSGRQEDPSVAPDGAGGFVVVWASEGSSGTDTSNTSVQAQRFDAAGLPVGGEFQVNTYTTGYQDLAVVAPNGGGGFVVVWQSDGSAGTDTDGRSIQGQRFDANGLPAGDEFQVNAYTTSFQGFPSVSDWSGGFVVAWHSDGSSGTDTSSESIQAQRFDTAGAPLGNQFQVNTYTTLAQLFAGVVAVGDGDFVVVWQSNGSAGDTNSESIQGQRFEAATGNVVGGQFQVNTYTQDSQDFPGIGSDGSNGFVAVWESGGSAGPDTSGRSTQARRFDGVGVPAGAEFQVNTYTTDDQIGYAAGPDGAGGFVVVWESRGSPGPDTSDFGIHGRRYDLAGSPVGPQFAVNTYTTDAQTFARVAPDGAGGFVVVWKSYGSGGSDTSKHSIHAQRFEGTSTATTTTTTTPTTATTSTTQAPGEALGGRTLALTTKPGRADKSKLSLVAKDTRLTLGGGNQSVDDPVVHGGALTISSTAGGFDVTHDLVGGWKYVGKAGQGRGYKWKSKSAPIRTILLKLGKLAIAGKGAGLGFDLDDDPDPVRVKLTVGAHAYCLEFGGASPRFKAGRLFRAKNAAAPATCP